jgi:hypothetical protein
MGNACLLLGFTMKLYNTTGLELGDLGHKAGNVNQTSSRHSRHACISACTGTSRSMVETVPFHQIEGSKSKSMMWVLTVSDGLIETGL